MKRVNNAFFVSLPCCVDQLYIVPASDGDSQCTLLINPSLRVLRHYFQYPVMICWTYFHVRLNIC